MPLYKVKPERTIEHDNVCYFEGDVVELASEYGAFHEPNIVVYVPEVVVYVPEVVDAEVVPIEEDEEDEDDAEDEEEKSSSSLVWHG
jgi:hypothetical protein